MTRLLRLVVIVSSFFNVAHSQNTVQIGNGTDVSANTLYGPVYRYSSTSSTRQFRSNILYEASELAAAGITSGSVIHSIAFNKAGSGGTNANPFDYKIYMGNTSNAAPLTVGTDWNTIMGTHTQVYADANQQIPTSSGWVTFNLATPYTYTGGSLEIAFEGAFGGSSPYTTDGIPWEYTSGFAGNIIGVTGSSSISNNLSGTVSGYVQRPNIRIEYVSTEGDCANHFTAFAIDSITGSGAKLSWTPGSGNNSFYVEYGPAGFTQGGGTKITGTYPGNQPPVILSGLSPETTYDVYVGEICNSGADSAYFPNPQVFTTTRACAPPTNLAVANITFNSVDISWDVVGAPLSHSVIYGDLGFNPQSQGTTVSAGNNPFTLSSLNSNYEYDVYLYADCGSDGRSDTIGPVSFTTPCNTYTAPYSNDFENDNLDEVPGCWAGLASYSSAWVEVEDLSGSAAPYSGSQALYFYSSGSSTTPDVDTVMAVTPRFTDLPAGDKQIRFWANGDDPAEDQLYIGTSASQTPGSPINFIDTARFDLADTYKEFIIPFTTANGYNGTDEYIVMMYSLGGTYQYFRVDEFNYEQIPACPKPTNLQVLDVTSTTATVSFDSRGGSSYEYIWGPSGFNQGTAVVYSTTSNPFTATGLSGDTEYELYLRNDCQAGGNGTSIWSGPLTFRTDCPAKTAPYFTDFESDDQDVPPACWNDYETYGPSFVEVENFTGTGSPYAGTQALYIFGSSGSATSDTLWAFSPQFSDLPAGDKRIRFYANSDDPLTQLIVGTSPDNSLGIEFNPIDTITFPVPDTYQQVVVNINAANGYNGTDQYLVLAHNFGTPSDYIRIDDFTYENIPACIAPLSSTLGATNVSFNNADLYWGAGSQGIKTYVELGSPSFTPGSGSYIALDSVNGMVDTLNIAGLSPQTTYEFYVRDSCAVDGLSGWIGPFSFTTACAPLTTPHTESFDLTTLPACWSTYSSTGEEWTFGTNSYAPSNDNTGNGGYYATVDDSESPSTPDATLESPLFDVSGLSNPVMKFYLASANALVTLTVDVFDGVTWHNAVYTHAAATVNTWDEVLVNLTPFAGNGIVAVRFVADEFNGGYVNDIAIDDVSIISGPSCFEPTALTVNGLLDTEVTLSWTPGYQSAQTEVWFGPQGFFQGSTTVGGSRMMVNGNSLFIDTLTQNTCYEYAVRSYCSPGDSSEWTVAYSFCTPCSGITAPHLETFDGTTDPNINPCWTVINQTSSSSSRIETYDGSSPSAFSAPNSVEFYNSAGSSGDLILVSPLLNNMSNSKMVRFQFYNESSNNNDLIIGTLSNPADASTFTAYDTIFEADYTDDMWHEVRYIFSSYSGSDNYVGLKVNLNSTYDYVYIDNFRYEEVTCPYPSNLMAGTTTNTTVDLNWTSGGASNWQIEYGLKGFTPGTGTVINANTNPFTVTGLSAGTIYDFYVRDSCGLGDVSLWEGPVMAFTTCSPIAAGTYTIGSGGDFASFTEASNRLNVCGVAGPVVLNVLPGVYTDKLHLNGVPGVYIGVPGVSAANTISINGNGAATLIWDGTGPQATILLDSTAYVSIDGMTIQNGSSSEAWGILVTGNSDHVSISNNTILMDSTSSSSDRAGIVVSGNYENDLATGAGVDSITITNNTIVGGYHGLALTGNSSSAKSSSYIVSGNVVREYYYYGMDMDYVENVVISNNTFTASSGASSAADGLYLGDLDNYRIEANNISTPDYALYLLDGNDGYTPAQRSLIANNMIRSDADYAMYINDFESTDIFHNTVVGEPAIRINDQVGVDIRNNIFVSDADFAFESDDALAPADVVDYNLYYVVSGTAFDIGTSTYSNLAAWQAGDANRNQNSIEGDPVFVSATDLHLIGGLANEAADPTAGISVDIDGDVRSATLPDIGADEYVPVPGDLALLDAKFIKGLCLSTNDSLELLIQSLVSPVNFATDPLTVNYSVSGPVNTNGSVLINSGSIGILDSVTAYAQNINLSVPGTYTLTAYIDPNAVNVYTNNDTLMNITLEVQAEFVVNPSVVNLMSANDSVEICVESPFLEKGAIFITEICHYAGATNGRPANGRPAWLTADDYIEITGVPGTDLAGITLEQWTATTMAGTYTFPQGTVLSPNGTAIIAVGQMNGSVSSPADYYYNGNGTFSGNWGSSDGAGRILKDMNGNILDAVAYDDGYNFPPAAGLSAADWSGNVPASSSTWGIRLEGADLNSAANWVSSSTSDQDPNQLNSGVTLPVVQNNGLTWSLNGTVIDSNACIMVGPYTVPGTYKYVAEYSNACGTYADTVTVIVPSCNAPLSLSGMALSTTSVQLDWDSTGTGSNSFEVQYGPIGFTPGTGTIITASGITTAVTGLTPNLCQEYYVRTVCGPNDNSLWTGPYVLCPDASLCDDLDAYAAGAPISSQSSLFIAWENNSGDEEVSTTRANSAPNALHLYDSGPAGFVDVVAYFDTISTGAWSVSFDMFVESGKSGYFNIQQNHALSGVGHLWGGEIYFKDNGTAEAQYSTANVVAGTFAYSQNQWFSIDAIIDLDNDTVWYEMDGIPVGVGYTYSMANPGEALQFNGVNFYTGTQGTEESDFYIDNFCVTPYSAAPLCAEPSVLAVSNITCDMADLSWTSSASTANSVVYYGMAGFNPLSGGTSVLISGTTASLSALQPGTAYEFYVMDICSSGDSSLMVGPVSFTTLSGPLSAAFSSTAAAPTATDLSVNFDASASVGADTYDWDFGDGNSSSVSTATTSHNYTQNGTYVVELAISGPCGNDTITDTLLIEGISVAEQMLSRSLSIYPNPARAVINIRFESSGSDRAYFVLRDLSGKLIQYVEEQVDGGENTKVLNISTLPKGVYMLEVGSEDQKAVRRIIVE